MDFMPAVCGGGSVTDGSISPQRSRNFNDEQKERETDGRDETKHDVVRVFSILRGIRMLHRCGINSGSDACSFSRVMAGRRGKTL